MPKELKKWLTAVSLTFGAVLLVFLGRAEYGIGIFLSIIHADWAIPYWLKIGTQPWTTVAIATIFGGIGLYNLYWIADRAPKIAETLVNFWERLAFGWKIFSWILSAALAGFVITKIGIKWVIIIAAVCFLVVIFQKIWPEQDAPENRKNYPVWLIKMGYAALPLFPIDPYFGASLGIAFAKDLKLKKLPAFIMLNIGNTTKMILITFGWNFINKATSSWSTISYLVLVVTIVVASVIVFRLVRKNPFSFS